MRWTNCEKLEGGVVMRITRHGKLYCVYYVDDLFSSFR